MIASLQISQQYRYQHKNIFGQTGIHRYMVGEGWGGGGGGGGEEGPDIYTHACTQCTQCTLLIAIKWLR